MGVVTVSTLDALLEASDAALQRAQGAGVAATLIVPSHAWGQQRKLQLRTRIGTGVDVVTHAQFVSQLWDVYGDDTCRAQGLAASAYHASRPLRYLALS